ncbi:MAG TPA: Rrf2 family transcriptional regulator [Acidimicrobiales bacterium]|nr:Rrf2 family transcriptional regulator [Acidimicrobiales bacterium]
MQISAKADYAVRAVVELAGAGGGPVKGERLATSQAIPPKFLEAILAQLRQHRILVSRRGSEGGYWLARPAEAITLADIIRAVDGPLASVRGYRPEDVSYTGASERLADVWLALRVSLRNVLEHVTVADLALGPLPPVVAEMLANPDARQSR